MKTRTAIVTIEQRKKILREIILADPRDYLVAGGAGRGVVIKFGKNSPNPHAVSSIKTRVEGSKSTVTELRLRDPAAAIAVLDRMGGI